MNIFLNCCSSVRVIKHKNMVGREGGGLGGRLSLSFNCKVAQSITWETIFLFLVNTQDTGRVLKQVWIVSRSYNILSVWHFRWYALQTRIKFSPRSHVVRWIIGCIVCTCETWDFCTFVTWPLNAFLEIKVKIPLQISPIQYMVSLYMETFILDLCSVLKRDM